VGVSAVRLGDRLPRPLMLGPLRASRFVQGKIGGIPVWPSQRFTPWRDWAGGGAQGGPFRVIRRSFSIWRGGPKSICLTSIRPDFPLQIQFSSLRIPLCHPMLFDSHDSTGYTFGLSAVVFSAVTVDEDITNGEILTAGNEPFFCT
jgi:hypothetical protein